MALRCPSCRQTHPDLARFCGRCGHSLPPAPPGPSLKPIPRPRPASGSSCCGWLFFFFCTLAFGALCLTSGSRYQHRRFEMPDSHRRAMFELLRPADVDVVVDLPDCSKRLLIQGTTCEVEAVERFVRFLGRNHTRRRIAKELDEVRSYSLPADKADLLANALKLSDAAVNSVTEAGSRSLLTITAPGEGHRAIDGMVRILRGERLSRSSSCRQE